MPFVIATARSGKLRHLPEKVIMKRLVVAVIAAWLPGAAFADVCRSQYDEVGAAVRAAYFPRGAEQKVTTKVDSAWRQYAAAGNVKQALQALDVAGHLLTTPPVSALPNDVTAPVRSAVASLSECIRNTPSPQTTTVAVRALVRTEEGVAAAGAAVRITLEGEVLGTTNAKGEVTVSVPLGRRTLEAVAVTSDAGGSATIFAQSGAAQALEIVMERDQPRVNRGAISCDQVQDGVLASDFIALTCSILGADGEAVKVRALSRVDVTATGHRESVARFFRVSTDGRLTLQSAADFRAVILDRFDPLTLDVIAEASDGTRYQAVEDIAIGRHRLTVDVAGSGARGSIPVRITHERTGFSFWAVTGADGIASFGLLPDGLYRVWSEWVDGGERRFARSAVELLRNQTLSLPSFTAASAIAHSPGRPSEPTAPPTRCYLDAEGNCHAEPVAFKRIVLSVRIVPNGTFIPVNYATYTALAKLKTQSEEELLAARGKQGAVEVRLLDVSGGVVFRTVAYAPLYEAEFVHEGVLHKVPAREVGFSVDLPFGAGTLVALRGWLPGSERTFDLTVLANDPAVNGAAAVTQ
jgi:hypothetical protein